MPNFAVEQAAGSRSLARGCSPRRSGAEVNKARGAEGVRDEPGGPS